MLDGIADVAEPLWHPESALWPGIIGNPPLAGGAGLDGLNGPDGIATAEEPPWHPESTLWAGIQWDVSNIQSAARGYDPAPLSQPPPFGLASAASQQWVRGIVEVVNSVRAGKMNATLDVALKPYTTTTTVTDARISATSAILLMPLNRGAAVEHASGGIWVSAQTSGSATLTHANDSDDNRRFRLLIIA